MCPNAAFSSLLRRATLPLALLLANTVAQNPLWSQTLLDWRHAGGYTVEQGLAGPAGGRADAVWFAGNLLYARTASGQTFQTADFQHWQTATAVEPKHPATALDARGRLPEAASKLQAVVEDPAAVFALAKNVYRSTDGGMSWQNITAYGSDPVIGATAHDLAVSPVNPDHIAVANDSGVWHSLDGGLSWSSLNEGMPNFPGSTLAAPAHGSLLPRLVINGQIAQLSAGREHWLLTSEMDKSEADRRRASSAVHGDVTAVAVGGVTALAGTADGRLFYSNDGGATYSESASVAAGARIEMIYSFADEPRLALAVAGNKVLQTANGGVLWNDLTGNLPAGKLLSVTGDAEGSAVYVAGEKGIFWARTDLHSAASPAVWTPLTAGLPEAKILSVRLENSGTQLFVATEGFGVYSALAPHRAHTWRLVNAADLSNRAAAPGSLLSIQGGKIQSARAGDLNFPVLAAAASGSQIQVPFEASGPSFSLDVLSESQHLTLGFAVKSHSPAIFIDGDGAPVFVDADTGLTLDSANTARAGSRVQLLATGLGRVRPDFPTGQIAPAVNPPAVAANVQAFLNGVEIKVTRATLAPGYVGCYLVEVEIPPVVNAGTSELSIAVDGETSNRVNLQLSQ